jgi:hypothetical protein
MKRDRSDSPTSTEDTHESLTKKLGKFSTTPFPEAELKELMDAYTIYDFETATIPFQTELRMRSILYKLIEKQTRQTPNSAYVLMSLKDNIALYMLKAGKYKNLGFKGEAIINHCLKVYSALQVVYVYDRIRLSHWLTEPSISKCLQLPQQEVAPAIDILLRTGTFEKLTKEAEFLHQNTLTPLDTLIFMHIPVTIAPAEELNKLTLKQKVGLALLANCNFNGLGTDGFFYLTRELPNEIAKRCAGLLGQLALVELT